MLNRFTDKLEDLVSNLSHKYVMYVTRDGIQCCMCSNIQ